MQARSLDRRPTDPTPEQIRLKCEQIRAGWAATGDKRYVPHIGQTDSESIWDRSQSDRH
jgi:hypothetical protein